MQKAILYVHIYYMLKIMQFVQCLWLEDFVEQRLLSHLKTVKTVAIETKVCHVIKLWTSFQIN